MSEQLNTDNGYLNACCTSTGKQLAKVQLPVGIEPKAVLGCPTMHCVGEPCVECVYRNCGCELTITQSICISLPVEYSLIAKTGEAQISCDDCHCQ